MGTGTAVSSLAQLTSTKMNLKLESVVNADIEAGAAIAFSKFATLASANILVGSAGGVATSVAVTGDVLISNAGVTSFGSAVIVAADISATAAIAWSQMAALVSAHILVGSAGGVATDVAVSGDITLANTGAVAIASGVIIDADVNASAAIAFSKLAALTSAYILVGNGSNVATAVAVSGVITLSNAGVTAFAAGAIVNADISASAAIVSTKILISGSTLLSDWRHATDPTKLDGADIYAASIPTTGLANPASWWPFYAYKSAVAINQAGVTIATFKIPANMTAVYVEVWCTATAATASVDVQEAGVTILSAVITPSAGARVAGTISDAALSSANTLTVLVTTNGTGTITELMVTIGCAVTHTTS